MPIAVSLSSSVVAAACAAVMLGLGMAGPAREHAPAARVLAEAPLAAKGDRLRNIDAGCREASRSAICADYFGVATPPQTITVERRIDATTSVLIRLPATRIASR